MNNFLGFLLTVLVILLLIFLLNKISPIVISRFAIWGFGLGMILYLAYFVNYHDSNKLDPISFIVNLVTLLGLYYILVENFKKFVEQKEKVDFLEEELKRIKKENAILKKGTNINYYYH